MKILRAITGHGLLDRELNAGIRDEEKIWDVVRWIKTRMTDGRFVKLVRKPMDRKLCD